MARIVLPVVPDGLVVDVVVNVEVPVLIPLWAKGTGPSPISGRGIIDTGSDITGVKLPILQHLAIPTIRRATTKGIAGALSVNLYRISLHVVDVQNLNLPWLSQTSLVIMELAQDFPFDVLIGLDILLTCRMFVDGPARQFWMDY